MILNLPKLGPVRFADNLSDAEIHQQIKALSERHGFEIPKRDVGIGTLLKEGFMRGMGQTGIALGDLIPSMIGSAVGATDYAQRQMQEAAASQEQLLREYPPQIGSYKQVGGPYEALQYGAETLGELGPSALTALIPGVGLGAVGTRLGGQAALRGAMAAGPATPAALAVAKEAATTAGRRAMYGGVYLGSLSQTAPEIFQNIYQETGGMEPGISALAGGIASILDTIIPGKLLDNLGTYGKLKAIERVAKDTGAAPKVWKYIGAEAAKAAGMEGLTESAQEAIGAAAEQVAGSAKPFFSEENQERFTEAFIKGAIGGTAFGTVGGLGKGVQEYSAFEREKRRRAGVIQEAEQGLQAQMQAEQAAGTLTPEKKAEYEAALTNYQTQRQQELEATFGGPEYKQFMDALKERRKLAGTQIPLPGMSPQDLDALEALGKGEAALKSQIAKTGQGDLFLGATPEARPARPAPVPPPLREQTILPGMDPASLLAAEQQAQAQANIERQIQQGVKRTGQGDLFSTEKITPPAPLPKVVAKPKQLREQLPLPGLDTPAAVEAEAAQAQAVETQVAKTGQGDLFAETKVPSPTPRLDTVTKLEDLKAFGKLFGIGPTARILRPDGPLAGKDISKPEDAAVVKQVLEAYASGNPAVGAAQKIEDFLKRPEFGGTGAARTDAAPSGVSTEVAGQPPAGAAPGTAGTSERGGVADTAPPAGGVKTTTAGKPGAVTDASAVSALIDLAGGNVGATAEQIAQVAERFDMDPGTLEELYFLQAEIDGRDYYEADAAEAKKADAAYDAAEKNAAGFGVLSADSAFGNVGNYVDLQDAIDSARENIADTFDERGITNPYVKQSLIEAAQKAFDAEVQRRLGKSAEKTTDGTQTTEAQQTKAQGQKAPAAPTAAPAAPEVESTAPITKASERRIKDDLNNPVTEVTLSDGSVYQIIRLNSVESMGLPGWHDAAEGKTTSFLGNTKDEAIKALIEQQNAKRGKATKRAAPATSLTNLENAANTAYERVRSIRAQKQSLLSKNGRVPAAKTEKRKQWDALSEQEARAMEEFGAADSALQKAGGPKKELPAGPASGFHSPAPANVQAVIDRGDFAGAVQALVGRFKSPILNRVANLLVPLLRDVKLVSGVARSYYDPNTNTVYLRDGATVYEVMHEASHAGLSHIIDNANHPVTRQLAQIFKAVRGSVDGAYGATDLQEFVAEIWSNEDFRNSMKGMMPNGQKQTLWSQFVNALRRWFGFPTKQDTAVDQIDRLLMEILDAPPSERKGEPLFAQAITQPNLASNLLSKAGSAISSSSVMNSQRASEWLGKFGNMGAMARQQAYRLLPMYAYAEVASKVLGPAAKKFSATLESMEGYQAQLLEAAQPLNRRLTEFTQDPQFAEWSKLVHESTIPDVRPYPESKKKYADSPEKLAQWVELNRRFEALTPEAQKLFRDLFASYKKLDKELEDSLEKNVFGAVGDRERAATAYQRIMDELASIRIDHYAPLFREGLFWLQYELNGVVLKPSFDSAAERDYAIKQLEAQGAKNIEAFSRVEDITSKNIPDGTMLAAIVNIMKKTGAGAEAIDELTNLVVKALPETSILKSRQYREGVPGYIDNAAYVFSRVSSNSAQQLARMRYGVELQNTIKEMIGTQRTLRGDESALGREMIDEFNSRRSFAMSPNLSSWSRYASTGAYYFNIAGNVSSAVVQTLQTPMVTMPYLGAEYGYVKAGKALLAALNLYRTSGLNRKVEELSGETSERQAMLSIENLLGRNLGEVEQLRPLIEAMKNRGLLQTSTLHEALQSERDPEGRQLFKGTSRLHDIANFVTNGMFHHSERMNREISAVAAYTLEMQNPKNTGTEAERQQRAIEKAIKTVQYTHGASGFLSGPSIAQNDLGRVFTVFKRFAFSMYYMLFDTMFRALPKANATDEQKQEIDAARRQLVGIYGMAALFAGAKGIPMYWIAELAYNMFQGEDDDDFDAATRKFLGDFLYKGPVNYLTNLSIADRVGWSDLIFREAKSDKADASFLSKALESALGAPYSMIDSMFRAKDLVAEGNIERGIEMALPVALRNVLKGSRYFTEGANTLRGDPVMGEISGYNSAMQILGLAPADLIRQYEDNAYKKTFDKALKGEVNKQLKRYYAALREGDTDGMMEASQKLFEFSDKHGLGITQDTITKSVRSRDKISGEMYTNHGISISNRNRAAVERAALEFE